MKSTKITFFVVLILALFSCKKDNLCDCLKSTGPIVKETRYLSQFDIIKLSDKMNLYIYPDTCDYVVIEAGKNLIPSIETNIMNQKLHIKNENKCNWVRSFKKEINIYLHLKSLHRFECTGSGNMYFMDTLFSSEFYFDIEEASGSFQLLLNTKNAEFRFHTGAADVEAAGNTDLTYFYHAGNGPMNLEQLKSKDVWGENLSVQHTRINATRFLQVNIKHWGNIYYKGEPDTIKSFITGSGQLVKIMD